MTLRELSASQPDSFSFTDENFSLSKRIIKKYPEGYQASAVIPLLDLAQRQEGWVSKPAIEFIADLLQMPVIRVLEVATFYTMFNLQPIGKKHIQVCTNLPCLLRGCDQVVKCCKDKLGINFGETTNDKMFSLSEVECAGACVNAPVVAINDDYYEDLTYDLMSKVIDRLVQGENIKIGSMINREGSSPVGNKKTLLEDPNHMVPKQDLLKAKADYEYQKKQKSISKGNN
ncbi:MAG: NADH-quinone oxidoreductase subunit E [Alphaproteobacteria bacterium TMED87]|nr:NADH-quinone oxidoreductase subunit NuoE [Rhodospirillaceae bacterium]OUV11881.1 MAG: NADH-quinone oxidoreductase subunit E [Alphaproteobacteria bacterium TMED87]